MLKSTIALLLAATLVACGGGNDQPHFPSGPQTQQPPITKGADTDTPVEPETGNEAIATAKKSLT
jgi:hypothetical protein